MVETVLILNMDSRFRGNDGGGYSHFHGNDRHKQNKRSLSSQNVSKFVIPAFLIFVLPKQPALECLYRVGIHVY
jgi:hypothetical protein